MFTCCGHTVRAQPVVSWAKTNGPGICFWATYPLKNGFWKPEISTTHGVIQLVICVLFSLCSYAKDIIKHISAPELLAAALKVFSLTLQVLIIHQFPTGRNMLLESAVYQNTLISFTYSKWLMISFSINRFLINATKHHYKPRTIIYTKCVKELLIFYFFYYQFLLRTKLVHCSTAFLLKHLSSACRCNFCQYNVYLHNKFSGQLGLKRCHIFMTKLWYCCDEGLFLDLCLLMTFQRHLTIQSWTATF